MRDLVLSALYVEKLVTLNGIAILYMQIRIRWLLVHTGLGYVHQTRNANMNTGSRWLQNMSDGNNAWASNNKFSGSTNVGKDGEGERYAARFMEVDGIVSEVSGDVDGVNVISRVSWKDDIGNQIENQLKNFMGGKSGIRK